MTHYSHLHLRDYPRKIVALDTIKTHVILVSTHIYLKPLYVYLIVERK